MVLTLYYDLLSQPSRAVYMFLKAANIKFEAKTISLMEGQHMTPEFAKVNPCKKVPAIVHDGFNLSESAAIMKYLAKEYKKDSFLGKTNKDNARVEEFISWQQLGLRKHCIEVFIPTLKDRIELGAFKKEKMDADKVKASKEVVTNAVNFIADYFLKDKDFVGGNALSIADIMGYCELQQLNGVFEEDLYNKNPKTKLWMERVGKALGSVHTEASASVNFVRRKFEEADKGASQKKK